MKLSTTLAFAAFLSLSSTMPLEKRQDITVTATIDVVETITDIVDVIVTVWLPFGAKPANQEQKQQVAQPNIPKSAPIVHITPVEDAAVPAQTPHPVAQQDSQEATQNQANQAQEQTNQAQAAKNQAAQEQSIKAQSQANEAQEKANDEKEAQNQAAQKQAAPAPETPSPAAPADIPAAPPTPQDSTSSDQTQPKSGGSCGEIGGSCTATNVTYFGGGLGACGWSNDTTKEDFFALAHGAPPPSYLPVKR